MWLNLQLESLGSHHLRPFLTYKEINCGKHNQIMTCLQPSATDGLKNVIIPSKKSRSQFHSKEVWLPAKNNFSSPGVPPPFKNV